MDHEGNVLALAEGSAVVRAVAADGAHSADCTVRVAKPFVPLSALLVSPASLTLKPGETARLTVTFIPADATDKTVSWSTTHAAVATVEDGLVVAIGKGAAVLRASSGGQVAACSVTVTRPNGGSPEEQALYREKYPGKNILIAHEGGELLVGTDGHDLLVGGTGDDWLEGGDGDDIYVWNPGGGHDVVSNLGGGENDELHFGAGAIPETLYFARNGDDLTISVPDAEGRVAGSVTVKEWYQGARLNAIVFADGTVLTAAEAEARAANPALVFVGTDRADLIWLSLGRKDSAIYYGKGGSDILTGSLGSDVFVGGPGDDFIRSWTLLGNLGGATQKTFVWNLGDGHDTVDFYYFTRRDGDGIGRLRLGAGVLSGDVSVVKSGLSGVRVELPDGSVTFLKALWPTGYHHPDEIVFADGAIWKWPGSTTLDP